LRRFARVLAVVATLGIVSQTAPAGSVAAPAPHPALSTRDVFPLRDLGRRAPGDAITATVTLKYNHQAELDALVAAQADRRSPLYHRFLTGAQFDAYFAPTPQQQAFVVAALRAAGLQVTHEFSNRTLLDVRGPSAVAERLFSTSIHSFSQGRYGARFANVTAPTIPRALASLVRAVSLSDLIVAHTGPRLKVASPSAVPEYVAPPRFVVPTYVAPRSIPEADNFLEDPGFESGAFGHGWSRCDRSGKVAPTASFTTTRAHTGKYAGRAGSASKTAGEQLGYTGVCQLVKVPPSAVLSAYFYELTDETSTAYAAQDVELLETDGNVAAVLAQTLNNHAGWVERTWNLAAYKGRELYVYFGVHGDGRAAHYTEQFVDDVRLTGTGPTPSPTATATPSPKPTAKPTAKPTPKPTATPTAKPTAKPTPSSTPTQAACGGDTPDSGPLANAYGFLATGVADAFDFPVQHGCNGTGQTVAVTIDSPVEQGDINEYLRAAGVTQTGKILNLAVDGGGTYSTDISSATGEASLDVETIAGLAPGANIRVYNVPDLSDQHIEDGYEQAVSDDVASVVNSSFGGCESADTSGANTTNAIAEQAAAKGITFVAASGDAGSDECGTGNDPPGPGTPASDPYFVAVGGVNFTQNAAGTLTSIGAQGDTKTSYLSGGGVSTYFGLPSYQSGIAGVLTSGRNTPDLSLPGVGAVVYLGTTVAGGDGTSWSSPQFAALLAEASELSGSRWGFVNPAIYNVFRASAYTDFTDVTTGNNGYYAAKPGFDQVTGIGAPKGYAFAKAL